jgi:hypothetical protein
MIRWGALSFLAAAFLVAPGTWAGEFGGKSGVLPLGTQIDNEALLQPDEIFSSEAHGGAKPYNVKLGDLAFNGSATLGGAARQAGISCATCHINGTTNAALFIPGMSSRPGNFDTTGPVFNPDADDHVVNPLTIPSLRGTRYLAPYGHNGRFASLRDFVHNVIVNEFSGPEPSPAILDAIVVYLQDIDFQPNPRLGPLGRLTGRTTDAEARGQALFLKPFPGDPMMSCATCHVPSGAFVDHLQHDVGTGGLFKTPTLLNADFNAPYFHDGRYDTYEQVVAYFNHAFALGLSGSDQQDLVAYLQAIGTGEHPYDQDGVDYRMQEVDEFSSVLDVAVPRRDSAVVDLAVDTIGEELREFAEEYPSHRDAMVTGGEAERGKARAALKGLVLDLRAVDMAMSEPEPETAVTLLSVYHGDLLEAIPVLKAAVPWSLFNPAVHDTHFAAIRKLYASAVDPLANLKVPADRD